ncbi:MAG: pyruvate formate lyase activating enzyme [Spirochaetes bacterium]|nr:MAG: pyruvate formate lyase activating enzyme [Spirochaetota bacterium]
MTRPPALYWRALSDDTIQCLLCPRRCAIENGQSGHCGARTNFHGRMEIPFYAMVSSLAVDPIEKKPLARYLPGTYSFSVGFWHCTMDCPFCQNWEIAHPKPRHVFPRSIEASELITQALAAGTPSISFTYSEPCLHAEYLLECMSLAKTRGLKTVLVTNGCIQVPAARDILALTDAANVDLKSSSAEKYVKVLGGSLETVINFIQLASSYCHLEVTALAVPGILDSEEDFDLIGRILSIIDPSIPLHITSYHPDYRWNLPALDASQVRNLARPAGRWLKNLIIHA